MIWITLFHSEIYDQAVESYVGPQPSACENQVIGPSISISAARETRGRGKLEAPAQSTSRPEFEVLELRHFGTELLTREAGLAVRVELATRLLVADRVAVDMGGVSDITPSVADEAFAKLAEQVGLEAFEKMVSFKGGTSLAKRLVEFVMKTRIKK